MPAKINLTGKIFGDLEVLEETEQRSCNGGVIWKCRCKCGKITYATSAALKRGEKKSCGCLQKRKAAELGHKNLNDLTGKRFGNLLVLQRVENHTTKGGQPKTVWECQCDCGSLVNVQGQSLLSGNTTSCGCIKSRGEEKISRLLAEAKIPFEREKIFFDAISPRNGHYRFDFYVNKEYIIEYDGRQHFEDCSWGSSTSPKELSEQIDNEKNEYCSTHGIPIIRIPYTHFNSIVLDDLLLETSNFIYRDKGML